MIDRREFVQSMLALGAVTTLRPASALFADAEKWAVLPSFAPLRVRLSARHVTFRYIMLHLSRVAPANCDRVTLLWGSSKR